MLSLAKHDSLHMSPFDRLSVTSLFTARLLFFDDLGADTGGGEYFQ